MKQYAPVILLSLSILLLLAIIITTVLWGISFKNLIDNENPSENMITEFIILPMILFMEGVGGMICSHAYGTYCTTKPKRIFSKTLFYVFSIMSALIFFICLFSF